MSGEQEDSDRTVDWSTEDLVRLSPADVGRRDFLKATGAGAGLALGSGSAAAASSDPPNAKTRVTYWTKEDRQNARQNIEEFDWAAAERDNAVESADSFLAEYSHEDLWHFVTSQSVARSSFISPFYHWSTPFLDSWQGMEQEWKMTDGEYTLPTNDFGSYRMSGLDEKGMFDPELADDQYLVNEEHPEMGEGWGVDDGYGWQDTNNDLGQGEGAWWNFVAYYNHWAVWRPGGIVRMMRAFTDAYLYTGDRKYATACAILLDRIGDVYPEMNVAEYPSPAMGGHYRNTTGGRQTGRVIGSHWEPNLVSPILVAYDAIFPGMEGNDELVDFLHGKTEEYPGLDAKDTVGKIRKNIEDGVHREMLPAAKESQLVLGRGSRGAVSRAARVLDEPDGYTREALDWVFKAGREVFNSDGHWQRNPEGWETTGGNTVPPLVGGGPGVGVEDRDGYFNESAPLYNEIRMASIEKVANILEGYDGFEGADLYEHPKFRRMLYQNTHLPLMDQTTPEIADTHVQRNYFGSETMQNGFQAYGDPKFAQSWYFLNGNSTAGIRGDIFSANPEQLSEEVEAVIEAEGPLDLGSQNLAGYGFAALRDGENYTRADYGVRVSFDGASPIEATTGYEVYEGSGTLQFNAESPDEHIAFEFEVPEDSEYQIELSTYRADTYGDARIDVDGERFTTFDFTVPGSEQGTYDLEKLGTKQLSAGTHTITFTSGEYDDGTDDDDDFTFGIRDLMLLTPEDLETRRNAEQKGNTKRAFWLNYGRNENDAGATSHAHRDTLNLGVAAFQLELANDLGYPKLASPKSNYFTKSVIAHNTVMVDAEDQHPQWAGKPKHFDTSDDRVQVIDVEAPDAYPQTDEYRRTTAMINVDEENSYAVDFFRIDGGDDHLFNFHGWVGDVATDGLDLVEQDGGTYAGPDVPIPGTNENTEYNEEVGNGFNYLDNVARDEDPTGTFSLDWDVEDWWDVRGDDADVHMRLTMLDADLDEVALADGHPPIQDREGNPDSLRYSLSRRQGTDLTSTFTSVIEPYMDDRYVESISEVPVTSEDGDASDARAVRVELSDGRVDYVASGTGHETMYEVGDAFKFKGFFAVYSEVDGEPEHAYLDDGKLLIVPGHGPLIQRPYARFEGTVREFTREMKFENEVTVEVEDHSEDVPEQIGEQIHIQADGPSGDRNVRGNGNGTYPVEDATLGEDDRVTVNVGDRTFIRGFKDAEELADGGYHYVIDEGDDVVIPVSESWSAN